MLITILAMINPIPTDLRFPLRAHTSLDKATCQRQTVTAGTVLVLHALQQFCFAQQQNQSTG